MQQYERKEISNGDLTKMKLESMGLQDKIDMDKALHFYTLFIALINQPDKVDHFKRTAFGDRTYTEADFNRAVKMAKAALNNGVFNKFLKIGQLNRSIQRDAFPVNYKGIEFTIPVRTNWNIWIGGLSNWGVTIRPTAAKNTKQFIELARRQDLDRGRAWNMDIAHSDREMLIGVSKENYEVFVLPVVRGDFYYNTGKEKYEELAFVYWDRYLR